MRRLPALSLILAVAASVLVGPPAAAEAPEGAEWSEAYFESKDGTRLHANIWRPEGLKKDAKTPALLTVGPYVDPGFGQRILFYGQVPPDTEPEPRYRVTLFELGRVMERGYTLVEVALRGYGLSEGCPDLAGPGEQADVEAAIDWVASRKWSNGRVGMLGVSYDGWTTTMGLASSSANLSAAVIMAGPATGYKLPYMNGIRYQYDLSAAAVYSFGYASDLPPAALSLNGLRAAYGSLVTNPGCYLGNLAGWANNDPKAEFWVDRDVLAAAARSRVPVFMTQGFPDAAVKADQFPPLWSRLRGPKRAWFGQFSHGRPSPPIANRDGFVDEMMRWLDHYVRGVRAAPSGLEVDPSVKVEQGNGRWRAEDRWPPGDGRYYALPVKAGMYRDSAGNQAENVHRSIALTEYVETVGPTGVGTWTFSQALPYDVHFAGLPKLRVSVETVVPDAHLVALLYDLDEKNTATMVSRGGYLLRESGRSTLTFELYPQDWRLEKGHRIGLLLSGADDVWFVPGTSNTDVSVQGGALSLPFLRFDRRTFLDGGPSEDISHRAPFAVPSAAVEEATVGMELPPRLK